MAYLGFNCILVKNAQNFRCFHGGQDFNSSGFLEKLFNRIFCWECFKVSDLESSEHFSFIF